MDKKDPSKESITFTDEFLDVVSENASPIKVSEHNKSKLVFEELQIISDEVVDFINKHAEHHVVSDEYKNTEIFPTPEDALIGEEFSIITDEVLDFITNNAKRHVISEKNKCKRLFLEPSKEEKISREEVTFFTREEEHYLDTQDNSVSGEITNFTIEDLKMFNQPKGEK